MSEKIAIPDIVHVRAEGLKLVGPLQTEVKLVKITSPETYLEADGFLSKIRNARKKWALKFDPIMSPLKAAKKNIMDSIKAADVLNNEVDGPLEALEMETKDKMRTFKLEEQKQLEEETQARKEEASRLEEEARKKQEAAQAAKSAPMKSRLYQQQQDLQEQAEEIRDTTPVAVRGASSSSRTVRKVRIVLADVLRGVVSGEIPTDVISINQVALNKYHKEDPATVEGWPGVTGYDDVIIAGR